MSFFGDKDERKPNSIEEFAEELSRGSSVKIRVYNEENEIYVGAETVETEKHPDLSYEEKIESSNMDFPTFLSYADYERRTEAQAKLKDWEKILNEDGIWTRDRPREASSLSKDPV